jgi:diguanylate cyclase (GGDEF)-like protein/PAS domain S-box-containing protein
MCWLLPVICGWATLKIDQKIRDNYQIGLGPGLSQQHQALMETDSNIPLPNVMDLLLDAVCIVDAQGRFVFVSAAGERVFGYAPKEMVGRPMLDFVFDEDKTKTLQAADGVQSGAPLPYFENRYVRKDGRIVHIMWSARWSDTHQMRVGVARDITERKCAESLQAALYAISEAAHAAEDLPALFSQIHHIIGKLLPANDFTVALQDDDRGVLKFAYHAGERDQSPQARKIDSGSLCAKLIQDGQAMLLTSDSEQNSSNCLGVPLNGKRGVIGALVVKSPRTEPPYTQKDMELLQFVSIQVAVAIERKQMEIRLQHSAQHDPLTDLPNRELFHDRLQTALRMTERSRTRLSLLYLDLDDFKQINDAYGHPAGDLLLQETARRLDRCVRKSDTVGRIGGDEFVVLLNNTPLPQHAQLVAEKIRSALAQPFELSGHLVHITPSIGIALYPEHGTDYKQLILQADAAMYAAKKEGGDRARMASWQGVFSGPKYRTKT